MEGKVLKTPGNLVAQRPLLRSDLCICKFLHKVELQQLCKSLHGDCPSEGILICGECMRRGLWDSLSKLMLVGRCSEVGEHAWLCHGR